MAIEIRVPRLGWSMEEGGFVGWLKPDGAEVKAGEPLYTLEGDKATQDVEATDDGTLHIDPGAPKPGTPVKVGVLLGHLLGRGEAIPRLADAGLTHPAPPMPPSSSVFARATPTHTGRLSGSGSAPAVAASPRLAASPRAMRVAAELGVGWSQLRGTGRSGRIRERDVRAAAGTASSTTTAAAAGSGSESTGLRSPGQVSPGTIAITDWTFPDLSIETDLLEPLGLKIAARQCKTEEELIALTTDADVVITQFARLTPAVVRSMRRARAIVRYGIGVDNVDLDAARATGIPVVNVPDYCIDEVADQTLAFILSLTRQVVPHHRHVAAGKWGLALPLTNLTALRGLVVGVVGFGRIGREVVRRLLPFKCRVTVFDPAVASEEVRRAGAESAARLEEVLTACDILSLHCPSNAATRRMIRAETLALLRPGARLVNVARGDLVDTTALVDALRSGRLAAAALDVCDPEPIPADHPLLQLPNVVLAPHLASASVRSVRTLRETVARLAAVAMTGVLPPNVVNGVTAPRVG